MRIAVIGTGRIGAFHAATLARHADVAEVVLADASPARAREVAGRIGAVAYEGPEEVFARGADAVVIAAPTGAHPSLVVRAAECGMAAFCEKPVGLDWPGTLDALWRSRKAGAVLQLGFMRRFDAGYVAAREAVRSGRLGRVHTARAVTSGAGAPPAGYLPLSGGLIADCMIHDFDALAWVTGQPVVEAYAVGSDAGAPEFRAAGDVDTAAAVLTLADGTLATVTATRVNGAGYDVRLELAGERDQIAVGTGPRTPLRSVEPEPVEFPGPPWRDFLERFGAAYEAEMDAFVRVVRGELANPCPGFAALEAQYVAEACALSRRVRRPVRIAEAAHFVGAWRWQGPGKFPADLVALAPERWPEAP
ncbi:Myo-inositol 2-dehydrogenase [Streptomyces sp. RB5]|uniref:Myo-inositol 2-dehydrogenase n=1 Tax=Streptomyces smaragdinus TaxID=2585196 RepID=A0A7K0CM67_9ACTN|nr:Gfo/Idh/MocA family oxidoreductase [Streptomyces smaragdinus]MQY14576.1 Myo-inositol 2-dehydrogenase [Streptomyces smaragdinus]